MRDAKISARHKRARQRRWRLPRLALLLLGLLIVALILTTHSLLSGLEERALQAARNELGSLTELKTAQISRWIDERRMDVNVIRATPYVARRALDVLRVLDAPGSETTHTMFSGWLNSFLEQAGYDHAILLDADRQPALGWPEDTPLELCPTAERGVKLAWREHRAVLTDLHQERSEGKLHVCLLAPFVVRAGGDVPAAGLPPRTDDSTAGLLLLWSDASSFTSTLLKGWPSENGQYESVMLREEGGELLVISSCSPLDGKTCLKRLAKPGNDHLYTRALASGEGAVEGVGVHDRSSVGVVRRIPGSSWRLLMSREVEAIMLPWYRQAMLTGLSIVGIALAVIFGVSLLWYRQQHATQASLLRANLRWKSVLEESPLIAICLDRGGRVTFANKHFLERAGWTGDEILGVSWFDRFIPEADQAELRQVFQATLERKNSPGFTCYQNEILTRTRGERTIAWFNTLSREVDGDAATVTCLGVDLTEQKRAEELTRNVIDSLGSAVAVIDGRGTLTQVNRAWLDFLYVNHPSPPEHAFVGSNYLEVCRQAAVQGDEIAGEIEQGLTALLVGKLSLFEQEYPCHSPDAERWFQLRARPLRGHNIGVVIAHVDITARVNHERNLRESERHLRQIYEKSPVGYQSLDSNGRLIEVNPSWLNHLGYKRAEVLGHDFGEFLPPESRQAFLERFPRFRSSGRTQGAEFEVRRKDGTLRTILFDGVFVRDAQGNPSHTHCVLHDVTALRQSEKALRNSLEEKTSLLKEVHHRVKNNLQIVSSLVNLQAGTFKDPKVLAALAEIRDRVRGIALLHETLYKSASLAHLDFAAYVQRLCEQIAKSATPDTMRRVRLETDLKEILLGLEQAVPCGLLLNELVTNSLKHAFPDNRTGRVSVCLERIETANREDRRAVSLKLLVSDDGVGLPQDFDLRQSSSLGMRLVATLASQLDGDWKVRNGSGGTTHELTFPVKLAPDRQSSAANPGSRTKAPPASPAET